jgi:hypothetical protein
MYWTGIDTPDMEPRRNKHTPAERRSKFTEEEAKKVVDGDLYFSKRSPAHQRFYVPIEKGEHGKDEGGLVCVTHKFEKPFPDIEGRWKVYDGGGNLVIKIRRSDDEAIVYEAMEAIEQALYRTPLGRVVGRDALRTQAESLCKAFGLDNEDAFGRYGEATSTFTVNTDAEALAKDALRDLLTYAPENGYDNRLGKIGADADGVGFAENGSQYAKLINGETDGFGKKQDRPEPLPLMSQPVFYAVLGYKGNGRAFQSRIDALMQAVGVTEDELNEYRGE